jgi:hypothetical protein
MTISHVGFKAGAVTGSGTATVAIRSVDGNGVDSADWAANTNLSGQTVSANSWNLFQLTSAASVSAGQIFGVKIGYGGTGTNFILQRIANFRATNSNLPYEAPSGTKGRIVGAKAIAVGSSSTSFYQLADCYPATAITNATFNTGTSTTEEGLRFQVPFKCRCVGIRTWMNTGALADFAAVLRNDAGTELSSSSTSFDGDYSAANAAGVMSFYFDNPVTLSPGTWYRATIQATSATNVTISEVTMQSTSYFGALPGGANQQLTRYTSSAWVDSGLEAIIPMLDILIDQVDDGTGSGGARVIGG